MIGRGERIFCFKSHHSFSPGKNHIFILLTNLHLCTWEQTHRFHKSKSKSCTWLRNQVPGILSILKKWIIKKKQNSKCKLMLIDWIIGLKAFKRNRFPKDTSYTNSMLFSDHRKVFACMWLLCHSESLN